MMEIKISVEDVDLTSIVGDHRAYDPDNGYDTRPQTLGDAVAAQVAENVMRDEQYNTLRARALAIRDEEIREQIKPLVAAAVAGPVQRTTHYGEPVGQPITLTELIIKETKDYLQRPAEQYGRTGETVIRKMVREAVDLAIKNEMAEVIKDEKAKVVAAVRAKAADLIATAVREGIGR